MAELPIARGVFLCENVIVEAGTRNVSLINCFTKRFVDVFPSPPQHFNVFAVLINGHGTMPLRLLVLDLKDDRLLFEFTGTVRFTSPLQELRTLIPVSNLVFPTAGSYEIMIETNDTFLARIPLGIEHEEGES